MKKRNTRFYTIDIDWSTWVIKFHWPEIIENGLFDKTYIKNRTAELSVEVLANNFTVKIESDRNYAYVRAKQEEWKNNVKKMLNILSKQEGINYLALQVFIDMLNGEIKDEIISKIGEKENALIGYYKEQENISQKSIAPIVALL